MLNPPYASILHIVKSTPSAISSDTVWVTSLRYLWDTLHNTNNLVPVMLCQYPCTQDRCCYYFVISTFHTSLRTSEILLPCTSMSTNDRTVGKEQQICYHWQKAVMDLRAGEHPQHNRLQTVLKVYWHNWCTTCNWGYKNMPGKIKITGSKVTLKGWKGSNIVRQ